MNTIMYTNYTVINIVKGRGYPNPWFHILEFLWRNILQFFQKSLYVHNACLITKCFQKAFFGHFKKSDSEYPICHYLVLTVLISPVSVGACHLLIFGITSLSNVFVFYEEHLNIFLDFLWRKFIDVVYFSSSE